MAEASQEPECPARARRAVFPSHEVDAVRWSEWLDCFRRGWVPVDTLVVCDEVSDRVALFWEGFGPYFARRGARTLKG